MTDREQARRDEQSRRDRAQRASFTVKEWCEYRRISEAMFYKLDQQGLAPRTHYAGKRRLISGDVREREAESTETNAA